MVPQARVELARPYGQEGLSLPRLPLRHCGLSVFDALLEGIYPTASRVRIVAVANRYGSDHLLDLIGNRVIGEALKPLEDFGNDLTGRGLIVRSEVRRDLFRPAELVSN